VKFANGERRGYSTVELTSERCIERIRVVGTVTERESPISSIATYAVQSGRAGAERA